jgi:hypothetical protein
MQFTSLPHAWQKKPEGIVFVSRKTPQFNLVGAEMDRRDAVRCHSRRKQGAGEGNIAVAGQCIQNHICVAESDLAHGPGHWCSSEPSRSTSEIT